MGQAEVLEILRRNGGWMTIRQVKESAGNSSMSCVETVLRKLLYWNEVDIKYISPNYKAGIRYKVMYRIRERKHR